MYGVLVCVFDLLSIDHVFLLQGRHRREEVKPVITNSDNGVLRLDA